MANEVGTGTTVTFSGVTYDVLDVNFDGWEVPVIDFTHMGSSNTEQKAGDLVNFGGVTVTVLFDGADGLPPVGTSATLTIDPTTATGSYSFSGAAFLQSISIQVPLEDRMTADLRYVFEGAVSMVA
jgi:hypothetical protein